ncbi:inner membrane protein [Modicisalibacter xianhensis]|uniref:Inner membrane protein n=1 Tax=Modicisalibacter xianhensis TaxID=442341 RepID=A0A4R8G4D5_9GAMM|nr:metal-dependent hydrolase [Halomonas xianhensis]TDX31479.1 inner membrane protein [Halomonas xianhensis]
MDSLTQACLGAAIGGAVLGRRLGRKAVLAGAILGTLPDLDVVIDYGDAVADYTYHRGFSHSLLVLAALSALLAGLTARLAPAWGIPLRHWATFYAACLLTHPLLDAFTTYGTQLWWPLPASPVSWASVFIIDPLYTLPLLISVLYVLARGLRQRALHLGLALSTLYLAFSLGAKLVIDQRMAPVLAARGLQEAPRLVQPTPFNTLLWRITVVEGDHYYEALSGLFDSTPPTLERFPRGGEHADTALALPSGRRLQWFAGPFLRYRVKQDNDTAWLIATDLRLGFPGFHPFNFRLAQREDGKWQPVTTREVPGRPADTAALMKLLNRAITPDMSLCPSAFFQPEKVAGPSTCPPP